jgi:hypothetical protein
MYVSLSIFKTFKLNESELHNRLERTKKTDPKPETSKTQSCTQNSKPQNPKVLGEIWYWYMSNPTTFWGKVFFIEFFVLVGRKIDRK